jgi:hypothetical protein
MIQEKPKAVYVNQLQLKHQRECREEARKIVVPNLDPVLVLAKAWQTGKLGNDIASARCTTVPARSSIV